MFGPSALRPWLLALLCAVLLSGRAGGAHLHLCFDGGEPPVSFHAFDVDLHQDEQQTVATHQDADVGVFGELLGKLLAVDLDLPAVLLAALIVSILLRSPGIRRRSAEPPAATAAASYLRPPLRGPPLPSSL